MYVDQYRVNKIHQMDSVTRIQPPCFSFLYRYQHLKKRIDVIFCTESSKCFLYWIIIVFLMRWARKIPRSDLIFSRHTMRFRKTNMAQTRGQHSCAQNNLGRSNRNCTINT